MRIPKMHELTLKSKNIMGVKIPELTLRELRAARARSTSSRSRTSVNQAIKSFQDVHQMVLDVAEKETALRKLLVEIEKTKRQVQRHRERPHPEARRRTRGTSSSGSTRWRGRASPS